MGIRLRQGRLFEHSDRAGSLPVMLVGQGTADEWWPGEDPIGKQVRVGDSDEGPWWTVVGIVGEVLHKGLDSRSGQPDLPAADAETESLSHGAASLALVVLAAHLQPLRTE